MIFLSLEPLRNTPLLSKSPLSNSCSNQSKMITAFSGSFIGHKDLINMYIEEIFRKKYNMNSISSEFDGNTVKSESSPYFLAITYFSSSFNSQIAITMSLNNF